MEADEDLLWISLRGLKEPLPRPWRACESPVNREVFYFNTLTGESTWDHPCDERHRKLYELERRKKQPVKVVTVSCSAEEDGSTSVACTSMAGRHLATIRCEDGKDFAGARALLAEELRLDAAYVSLVLPNATLPSDEELVESYRV